MKIFLRFHFIRKRVHMVVVDRNKKNSSNRWITISEKTHSSLCCERETFSYIRQSPWSWSIHSELHQCLKFSQGMQDWHWCAILSSFRFESTTILWRRLWEGRSFSIDGYNLLNVNEVIARFEYFRLFRAIVWTTKILITSPTYYSTDYSSSKHQFIVSYFFNKRFYSTFFLLLALKIIWLSIRWKNRFCTHEKT